MCAWAFVTRKCAVTRRIRNVALVVRTIQVFAVPARGKYDGSADATWAWRLGELGSIGGAARCPVAAHDCLTCLQAAVADTGGHPSFRAKCRISGEHAEALDLMSDTRQDSAMILTGFIAVVFFELPLNGRM